MLSEQESVLEYYNLHEYLNLKFRYSISMYYPEWTRFSQPGN